MNIDIEHVGERVLIRFENNEKRSVTISLKPGDAANLGSQLCTVAMLGSSVVTDEAIHEMIGTDGQPQP